MAYSGAQLMFVECITDARMWLGRAQQWLVEKATTEREDDNGGVPAEEERAQGTAWSKLPGTC